MEQDEVVVVVEYQTRVLIRDARVARSRAASGGAWVGQQHVRVSSMVQLAAHEACCPSSSERLTSSSPVLACPAGCDEDPPAVLAPGSATPAVAGNTTSDISSGTRPIRPQPCFAADAVATVWCPC